MVLFNILILIVGISILFYQIILKVLEIVGYFLFKRENEGKKIIDFEEIRKKFYNEGNNYHMWCDLDEEENIIALYWDNNRFGYMEIIIEGVKYRLSYKDYKKYTEFLDYAIKKLRKTTWNQ